MRGEELTIREKKGEKTTHLVWKQELGLRPPWRELGRNAFPGGLTRQRKKANKNLCGKWKGVERGSRAESETRQVKVLACVPTHFPQR